MGRAVSQDEAPFSEARFIALTILSPAIDFKWVAVVLASWRLLLWVDCLADNWSFCMDEVKMADWAMMASVRGAVMQVEAVCWWIADFVGLVNSIPSSLAVRKVNRACSNEEQLLWPVIAGMSWLAITSSSGWKRERRYQELLVVETTIDCLDHVS